MQPIARRFKFLKFVQMIGKDLARKFKHLHFLQILNLKRLCFAIFERKFKYLLVQSHNG